MIRWGTLLAVLLAAGGARASGRPLAVTVLQAGDGAATIALRIGAELQAHGHAVRPLPCAGAEASEPWSRSERCLAGGPRDDAQIVVAAVPAEPVSAWVRAGTRMGGPFRLREAGDDADAPAALASEVVAWVEALARPEPPPSVTAAAPVAVAPIDRGARWSLGVSGLYLQSLSGLGGRFGPELSAGVDWTSPLELPGRWGLRLGLWGARWGPDPVAHGVAVRRSPLVGALLLTAALVRGRWALEGHAGAGAEWAALDAVDTADTAELPFQKATRFGLVGQTGAALLRGLGDGWHLGLELRLVWHIPAQVVVIGDRHFGNSSVPSAGASLTLRWGSHGL